MRPRSIGFLVLSVAGLSTIWIAAGLGNAGETRTWQVHDCNVDVSGVGEPCDLLAGAVFVNGSASRGWRIEVSLHSDLPMPNATLTAHVQAGGLELTSPPELLVGRPDPGTVVGAFDMAPYRRSGEVLLSFSDAEEEEGYALYHKWIVTWNGRWPQPPVVAADPFYDGAPE